MVAGGKIRGLTEVVLLWAEGDDAVIVRLLDAGGVRLDGFGVVFKTSAKYEAALAHAVALAAYNGVPLILQNVEMMKGLESVMNGLNDDREAALEKIADLRRYMLLWCGHYRKKGCQGCILAALPDHCDGLHLDDIEVRLNDDPPAHEVAFETHRLRLMLDTCYKLYKSSNMLWEKWDPNEISDG